jgi:hypothetical protein
MDRKAEEEPIVELSATTDNVAGRPPVDVQQAEDRQEMP